jgi:hypothetical protein
MLSHCLSAACCDSAFHSLLHRVAQVLWPRGVSSGRPPATILQGVAFAVLLRGGPLLTHSKVDSGFHSQVDLAGRSRPRASTIAWSAIELSQKQSAAAPTTVHSTARSLFSRKNCRSRPTINGERIICSQQTHSTSPTLQCSAPSDKVQTAVL